MTHRVAKPNIEQEKCKKCGACVSACPMGVLEWDESEGPRITNAGDCAGCRSCELQCSCHAITLLD